MVNQNNAIYVHKRSICVVKLHIC